MQRQRFLGWRKRPSAKELRRQAALLAQAVKSEAAFAHQMELAGWYENDAGKLERKIVRREHTG